jgi:hypothetical protein
MTNRKLAIIERKLKELKRRYPANVYEINEAHQIIRVSGRRHHKTKEIRQCLSETENR